MKLENLLLSTRNALQKKLATKNKFRKPVKKFGKGSLMRMTAVNIIALRMNWMKFTTTSLKAHELVANVTGMNMVKNWQNFF